MIRLQKVKPTLLLMGSSAQHPNGDAQKVHKGGGIFYLLVPWAMSHLLAATWGGESWWRGDQRRVRSALLQGARGGDTGSPCPMLNISSQGDSVP